MFSFFPEGSWKTLLLSHLSEEERNKILSIRPAEEAFPPANLVFEAFRLTPPENTKVVILGQDPYHGPHQAHGLAFSVREGNRIPPSLQNIMKEYRTDLGKELASDLTPWAKSGVLLLNTVLTVEPGRPLSHSRLGWQILTNAALKIIHASPHKVVYLLWGKHAEAAAEHLDNPNHLKIISPHPSPLSANRGFFGSRPFSRANAFLGEEIFH